MQVRAPIIVCYVQVLRTEPALNLNRAFLARIEDVEETGDIAVVGQ